MPTETFNSSTTWLCPALVTLVTVECRGGGGGGGNGAPGTGGKGGGGGAYARKVLSVTPGQTYTVNVGLGGSASGPGGDSWFNTSAHVLAKGGEGNSGGSDNGEGGQAASCIGDVKFSGGNGGPATANGGGGGGGAGDAADGSAGTVSGGAGGISGGGAGGAGGTATNGVAGTAPGGGGGGAGGLAYTPAPGAVGQVILTYNESEAPVELHTPNICFLDGTGMYGTDTTNYLTTSGNNVIEHVKHKWKGAYLGSRTGGFSGHINLAPGRWGADSYSLALITNGSSSSFATIDLGRDFGFTDDTPLTQRETQKTLAFGFAVKSIIFTDDAQQIDYDATLDNPAGWITIFDQFGQIMFVITMNTTGTGNLKVAAAHPGTGVTLAQTTVTISTTSFDYFEFKIVFGDAGEVIIEKNGTEILNESVDTMMNSNKIARFITISTGNAFNFQGQYTDFYVGDDLVVNGHSSRVWVKPLIDQGLAQQFVNNNQTGKNHTYLDERARDSSDYVYPSLPRRAIDTYKIDEPLHSGGDIGLVHAVAVNMGLTGGGPLRGLFWKVLSDTPYPFSGYITGNPNYQVMQHINNRTPFNDFYWRQIDFASGYGHIGIMYNE